MSALARNWLNWRGRASIPILPMSGGPEKGGWKDWSLVPVILDGDWVLVTKNSIDFRGPAASPGSKGLYASISLHAGLVCINRPVGMDLDLQLGLFSLALDELEHDDGLINQVLEVTAVGEEGEVEILRYRLPDSE